MRVFLNVARNQITISIQNGFQLWVLHCVILTLVYPCSLPFHLFKHRKCKALPRLFIDWQCSQYTRSYRLKPSDVDGLCRFSENKTAHCCTQLKGHEHDYLLRVNTLGQHHSPRWPIL